jgi:hypothetical protein
MKRFIESPISSVSKSAIVIFNAKARRLRDKGAKKNFSQNERHKLKADKGESNRMKDINALAITLF